MINSIIYDRMLPYQFEKVYKDSPKNEISKLGAPVVTPGILFVTSYPPRECGIATYSLDLIKMLNEKFNNSFAIKVCALESQNEKHTYEDKIDFILDTDDPFSYASNIEQINTDNSVDLVVVQHEFGFYAGASEYFLQFLNGIKKPIVIVFHTVLPSPSDAMRRMVQLMYESSSSLVVMTKSSQEILAREYDISGDGVSVIPHGTHLVSPKIKEELKDTYGYSGRPILATFGLLSSGKGIETTLKALPAIIEMYPDVLFLVIGKTHPSVVKNEGEAYREKLQSIIAENGLGNNVEFLNYFIPLPKLLEFLQMTDVYLFTSKDPNQAVSGTLSYAISCGCPIISTPIPHAREILDKGVGTIVDFANSDQLSKCVITLLADELLRENISSHGLHQMAGTAWENSAISHALLFEKVCGGKIKLRYHIPSVSLDHLKRMTTERGMLQFSKLDKPDIESGYTLDDNARALIVMCKHYERFRLKSDLHYIQIYVAFIASCLQDHGYFLNYMDEEGCFTAQNETTNLADANGRALWALGYLISMKDLVSDTIIEEAEGVFQKALTNVHKIHSTRAMAFIIKGLYYRNLKVKRDGDIVIIELLASKLIQMYLHESSRDWNWFESYLTYANSTLPEAVLYAWLTTGDPTYKRIAEESFDFLISKTFSDDRIKVISNKGWYHRGDNVATPVVGGEQPIDVAYSVMALSKFYSALGKVEYLEKMFIAFSWFLGNNTLHQIIYNPCTGGCYDGLEDGYINLNQGAESTVSYLMARLEVGDFGNKVDVIRHAESMKLFHSTHTLDI